MMVDGGRGVSTAEFCETAVEPIESARCIATLQLMLIFRVQRGRLNMSLGETHFGVGSQRRQ